MRLDGIWDAAVDDGNINFLLLMLTFKQVARQEEEGSIGVAVHLSLCDDINVIFHKETFIRHSSLQPVLVTIIFLSILWTVAKSGDKLNSSFISGSTSLCPQHIRDTAYS